MSSHEYIKQLGKSGLNRYEYKNIYIWNDTFYLRIDT